jgi:hypothetical protein
MHRVVKQAHAAGTFPVQNHRIGLRLSSYPSGKTVSLPVVYAATTAFQNAVDAWCAHLIGYCDTENQPRADFCGEPQVH